MECGGAVAGWPGSKEGSHGPLLSCAACCAGASWPGPLAYFAHAPRPPRPLRRPGRLWPRDDEVRQAIADAGLDCETLLSADDLCKGDDVSATRRCGRVCQPEPPSQRGDLQWCGPEVRSCQANGKDSACLTQLVQHLCRLTTSGVLRGNGRV